VVSPGVAFGEHGEGYVRIAMVENEQADPSGRGVACVPLSLKAVYRNVAQTWFLSPTDANPFLGFLHLMVRTA